MVTMTRTTPAAVTARHPTPTYGTLLMLGSALCFSTIAVFTRGSSLPLAETLVVRGVAGAVAVAVVARWVAGERLFDRDAVRGPALAVAALFTVGMTALVVAYRFGSTITVSVVYSTVPLIVAGIQLVLLRERRPRLAFWLAGVGVVVGVVVMAGGGLAVGDLIGMGLALLMTVCVAGVVLMVRRYPTTPMLPASALASLLSALVALPFTLVSADGGTGASGGSWSLGGVGLNVAFGVVTLGLGRVFLLRGAALVPARRAAMIDVLDAPLSPLWTLAVLGEVPGVTAVIGAGVVLVSVAVGVWTEQQDSG